jgi:diguanylate cyclase (GGDEF)-like protein
MLKARLFDFTLFLLSIVLAYYFGHFTVDNKTYIIALGIFWLFSCLYYHLRVFDKNGQTSIDYGINYELSFGIFTGPLGLILYEASYRLTIYIYKKVTKRTVPGDFLDTFYNIGAFGLAFSVGYYLYNALYPIFHPIPFGFWILICLLAITTSLISDIFLTIAFFLIGEFKTIRDAIQWNLNARNLPDMGKSAFTNGLLILFLQEQRWEIILSLFIINYFVSSSFNAKSQSIKDKMERDQFKKMAYTDFLTNIPNRAYMDKKIEELNKSGEFIGVVVVDLDNFKKINDQFNHSVGDKVIQHFVQTLKQFLNGDDFLFRSGGEEFTIFLRKRTFDDCVTLVERIRVGVAKMPVDTEYNTEKISISYTASFGFYYYKVNEQVSMEKGYIYADNLLMESKQLGRNRVSAKNGLLYRGHIQKTENLG